VPSCFAKDAGGAVAVKWKGLSYDAKVQLSHTSLLSLSEARFVCRCGNNSGWNKMVSQCQNCLGSSEFRQGCLFYGACLSSCHRLLAATSTAVEEEGLRKGARVELHSLKKAEHNGKQGELLEFDAVAGRWGLQLTTKKRLSVQPANLTRVEFDTDQQAEVLRWMSENMEKSLPFPKSNLAVQVLAQFEPAAAANVLLKIKAQNERSKNLVLAFASGFHPRLGQASSVDLLGDVFRMLAQDHIIGRDDVSETLVSGMLVFSTADEIKIMAALEERMEGDDYRRMEKRIKKDKMR